MASASVDRAAVLSTAPSGDDGAPLRLGIPAYGYPGETDLWAELSRAPVGAIVIVDPADGPGTSVDPTYVAAVAGVRAGGALLFGYVDTGYGCRAVAEIVADAVAHRDWYGVTGIFLDQTPGPRHGGIEDAIAMLRDRGFAVALNPGQPVIDRRWVDLADHVIVFEGRATDYAQLRLPSWARCYPAAKFWHLVYGVDQGSEALAVMRRAASLHAGVVFVTDGTMPNSWRRLPPYWAEELAALATRGVPAIPGAAQ